LKYESIEIKPIPIHQDRRPRRPATFILLKWSAWFILAVILVVLALSLWFVFSAKQVTLQIEPEPDTIAVHGGLAAPRLRNYYLLRPGKYTLQAEKACYESLDHSFQVGIEKSQTIDLNMRKQPGRLSIQAHQQNEPARVIHDARVVLDGVEVGKTPVSELKVNAGRHQMQIGAARFQKFEAEVTINGCDELQSFNVALIPGWSDITIGSIPEGAEVRIDDKLVGSTPLEIELPAGTYQLELSAERFKSWTTQLEVEPNHPRHIEDIRLMPADGVLAVRTKPSGANVMIGKRFVGRTPLKTNVTADKVHVVQISKPGYEKASRKISLPVAASKTLSLDLKPVKGIINLKIEPADAQLMINGKLRGTVPQKLQLVAVEHQLEFRKSGYHSKRIKITPRPGFPQELQIALKRQTAVASGPQALIRSKNGYVLKLIKPRTFALGSSRREQGRRSNETLRKVKLLRPFYMGVNEVTNKAFKAFLASHNSGSFKGKSLNRDNQPVVQITWQQAAMFCNWLSANDGLPPAYAKKGNEMVIINPLTIGYRLPTEAEWEYCARRSAPGIFLKYSWGDKFPPADQSGNFADASAKGLLNSYLATYNDGYAVTAPPSKFKANSFGLYDFGGNVAEWCHDYYAIYSYDAKKVYIDPTGPETGKHRVVKGSSWKDATISALRLAHRDYNNSKRDDLGFRICRYAE
jgi:formylglycine-generating enzyme required for sulfatase activity